MTEYVVYYRVSTERQGRSGLGLDAQRVMVEHFLKPSDRIISEFTEIQSGKRDDRVQLWKAINLAKRSKAKLLIPKLDRFSRKVSFVSGIIDQGIDLAVCEHPNVTTFFLHLLACFAEEERRQISERTKAALSVAKTRGTKLGQNAQNLARQRRAEKALFASTVAHHINKAYSDSNSLAGAARLLNQRNIPTANNANWHAQTVKNYKALIST